MTLEYLPDTLPEWLPEQIDGFPLSFLAEVNEKERIFDENVDFDTDQGISNAGAAIKKYEPVFESAIVAAARAHQVPLEESMKNFRHRVSFAIGSLKELCETRMKEISSQAISIIEWPQAPADLPPVSTAPIQWELFDDIFA